MTTRPGYIWSGTEWVSIGQEAIQTPFYYQATAPSSPSTGDIWIDSDDDVPGIDTSQFLRWRKTATGGETSVSGTDDTGLTLAYTAGYEQVYLNGVLLVRGQDYTATTGTSITGLTALAASDVVEVFGVVARVVGDVYTQAQTNSLLDTKSPVSTTGLILLNETVLSAVSNITISNIFTSSYKNYLITFNETSASATAAVQFQLTASGTPSTGTYYYGYFGVTNTGSTSNSAGGAFTDIFWFDSTSTYADRNVMAMKVFDPQVSTATTKFVMETVFHNGSNLINRFGTGNHITAASYDGFKLNITSGTITGTIKVYGYK